MTPEEKRIIINTLMDISKRDNFSYICMNTYRPLDHEKFFQTDHQEKGYTIQVTTEESICFKHYTTKKAFHIGLRATLYEVIW